MTVINESLNLVLPICDAEGVAVYAYHSPISHEVFMANYRSLSAAKSALSVKGAFYMMDAGPRVAALTLRDEGLKDAAERGEMDKQGNPIDERTPALLGEIKRLTTVLVPAGDRWDMLPVDIALSQGKIDAEEWEETESAIVFFTFHYAMGKKANRPRIATATASVLKGSITSSSAMDFVASLPISTPSETSDSKAASSVPS